MTRSQKRDGGFVLLLVLLFLAVISLLVPPLLAQSITGRAGVLKDESRQQAYELAVSALELFQAYYAKHSVEDRLSPGVALEEAKTSVNQWPWRADGFPGSASVQEIRVDGSTVTVTAVGEVPTIRPDGGTTIVKEGLRAWFTVVSNNGFSGQLTLVDNRGQRGSGNNPSIGLERIVDEQGRSVPPRYLAQNAFDAQLQALLGEYPLKSPGSQVVDVRKGDVRAMDNTLYITGNEVTLIRVETPGNLVIDAQKIRGMGQIVAGGNVIFRNSKDDRIKDLHLDAVHAGGNVIVENAVEKATLNVLVSGGTIEWKGAIGKGGSGKEKEKEKKGKGKKRGKEAVTLGTMVSHASDVKFSTINGTTVNGHVVARGQVLFAGAVQDAVIRGVIVGGSGVSWKDSAQLETGGIAGMWVRVEEPQSRIVVIGNGVQDPSRAELILNYWEVFTPQP